MDYYEILGVSRSSEKEVIDAAYRALMKKYHPDRWKGDSAVGQEKARQLNAAYETLGDPNMRAAYDHQCSKRSNEAPKEESQKASGSAASGAKDARPQDRSEPPAPSPRAPSRERVPQSRSNKGGFALAGMIAAVIMLLALYLQTTDYSKTYAQEASAPPSAAAAISPPADVTTTSTGLQIKILQEGEGPSPALTDVALVGYKGMLTDGTVFDENANTAMPVDGVVAGFSEALQRMKRGGSYRVFIPPHLGYGDQAAGPIPPNSTLIFDVKFYDFKSKAEVEGFMKTFSNQAKPSGK